MSEIEKMKQYIERTKMGQSKSGPYQMNMKEALELAHQVIESVDFPIEVITLAFNYGKAKGYRAAKAERRVTA